MVEVHRGELVGAALSPLTKQTLQRLVGCTHKEAREIGSKQSQASVLLEQEPEYFRRGAADSLNSGNSNDSKFIRVEVPLKNKDEFFQILQYGLSGLNTWHDRERTRLLDDIGDLAQLVSRVAVPPSALQQTDLYAWRAIFELYLNCGVFFSMSENQNYNRTPTEVQTQLRLFSSRLDSLQKTNRFRRKDSSVALQRFLLINLNLLRNLKFQDLNVRAAEKILKKFDKRTSLGAQQMFSAVISSEPFSTQAMAKVMCAQMSNEVFAIVPLLNDYLCPVCFSVSYKPIRLQCSHVFCIRCMVVMQRSKQTHCPLCRGDVIMQADSCK